LIGDIYYFQNFENDLVRRQDIHEVAHQRL
jgi:hypothetical protein